MGISVRCGEFAGGTTNKPSLEGVVAYLMYIRKVIESRLFQTKLFLTTGMTVPMPKAKVEVPGLCSLEAVVPSVVSQEAVVAAGRTLVAQRDASDLRASWVEDLLAPRSSPT